MHYTGMAAARFTPMDRENGSLAHALNISSLGTAVIILVTVMILGLSLLSALIDRRFSAQVLAFEVNEKRFRHILETSFDAFVAMAPWAESSIGASGPHRCLGGPPRRRRAGVWRKSSSQRNTARFANGKSGSWFLPAREIL
jgi:hypothetical protein